jgi:DNA-binding PadR family transcriptional regulator
MVLLVLPPSSYAVLGLLSFGRALSGYDLKRWADHSLHYFFWSPAQSAIYTELRRLEELGFVEPVGESEGPRGRLRYRITPAGEKSLAGWVGQSPTPAAVVKDHALLKVWLGHVIDPAQLRAVVDAECRAAEDHLGEIRFSSKRAEEVDLGYAALVERCCERIAAARAEAFRELADALTATAPSDSPKAPSDSSAKPATRTPVVASTKGNKG